MITFYGLPFPEKQRKTLYMNDKGDSTKAPPSMACPHCSKPIAFAKAESEAKGESDGDEGGESKSPLKTARKPSPGVTPAMNAVMKRNKAY